MNDAADARALERAAESIEAGLGRGEPLESVVAAWRDACALAAIRLERAAARG